MSDRYAAMRNTGACEHCGRRGDGIATYRPDDPKPISADGRASIDAYLDKGDLPR